MWKYFSVECSASAAGCPTGAKSEFVSLWHVGSILKYFELRLLPVAGGSAGLANHRCADQ